MIRFKFVLVFLLSSAIGFAQTGTIKGTLKDETTGEGLISANVIIEGTGQGASTDIDGNFIIPKVKVGKLNLVLTSISYSPKTISIDVYPDKIKVINS